MGKVARLGRALALCLAAAQSAGGVEKGDRLERRFQARLAEGDDAGAAELIRAQLERTPRDPVLLYNAACVHGRLGQADLGASYLLEAIKAGFGDFSQIASVFENPQRHVAWGASTEDQVSWTSSLGNGASVFTYYMGERLMEASGSATFAQISQMVHDDVVSYIDGNGNMTMQNPQMRGANQSMTLDDFFRQR